MDSTRLRDSQPIALVGLMGAGKSVVAARLGARLGLPVIDVDRRLEDEECKSVAEIFRVRGEAWFRAREARLLEEALAQGACVLACGGGAVLEATTRLGLRERCRTVWLEVTPAAAAVRVGASAATRPLLAGDTPERRLETLLAERAHWYEEVACARVATDGRDPDQVAEAVEQALARLEAQA